MAKIWSDLKQLRLVHLAFALTFFVSGVLVNAIQLTLYVTLRPLSRYWYRKINWYLCFAIYAQLVFLGDWWSNSRIKIYVDKQQFEQFYGKEHALCIMNHHYEIDWLIGWMLCNRIHLLGNCKAYAKKSIRYIPVVGWAWKCAEFVFLERSFALDQHTIASQIKQLAEHPDPMWLLLYPEGTRFTPAKHEASVQFAKHNNLPVLKHHLIPRTRGFVTSLPCIRGKVDAIYDIQVAFSETCQESAAPSFKSMLLGRSVTAHMYFRRISLDDVPTETAKQETFLYDMFEAKDQSIDAFIKHNYSFTPKTGLVPFEITPPCNSLYMVIFWLMVTCLPTIYFLICCVMYEKWLVLVCLVAFVSALYLLLNKAIGQAEIKSSSSYGMSSKATKSELA